MINPAFPIGSYGVSGSQPIDETFLQIIPGKTYEGFLHYLANVKRLIPDDIGKIDECIKRTVGVFLPLDHGTNQSRTNILVGNVQSGKTTLIEGIISLASDSQIPLVAVLTGTKKNLTRQTIDELVEFSNFNQSGKLAVVTDQNGLALEDAQRTIDLHYASDSRVRSYAKTLVLPIIKNKNSINNLCEFLGQLNSSRLNGFLIIDDEADEFSLDTNVRNNNLPASACYQACTRLRRLLPAATTYLQVTATPQGPLLIDSSDPLSPDYVTISDPGVDYCGGSEYFLDTSRDLLVKDILPQERPQTWVDSPATRERIPASLIQAFHYFLAAGGILLADRRLSSVTMMIHPASQVRFHTQYQQYISRLIENYSSELGDDFDLARSEIANELAPFIDELLSNYDSCSSRDEIISEVIKMIFQPSIKVLNGDNDFRNTNWSTYWNSAPAHFILGAQCIARGFVVKNLVTSYLPRSNQPANPNSPLGQIDTIQQQARFFGYKKPYLKLCRVFVAPSIKRQFTIYTLHESILRNTLIARYRQVKPYQGLQLPIATQFAATRRNILRNNPMIAQLSSWFMEGYPYALSLEKHQARIQSLSQLLSCIFPEGSLPPPGSRRVSPSQPTPSVPASDHLSLSSFLDFLGNYPFSDLDNGLASVATFIRYLMDVNPTRFTPESTIASYVFTKERGDYPAGADSASEAFGSLFGNESGNILRRNGLLIPTDARLLRTRFRDRSKVLEWDSLSQFKINPHGGPGQDRDKHYAHPAKLSIQIHLIDIVNLSTVLPRFISLEEISSTSIHTDVSSWLTHNGSLVAQTVGQLNALDLPYYLPRDGRQSVVYPVLCIKFPPLFDVVQV